MKSSEASARAQIAMDLINSGLIDVDRAIELLGLTHVVKQTIKEMKEEDLKKTPLDKFMIKMRKGD